MAPAAQQISQDVTAHIRLAGKLLQKVEDWRRVQRKIPTRSRAVEILIESALSKPDGVAA